MRTKLKEAEWKDVSLVGEYLGIKPRISVNRNISAHLFIRIVDEYGNKITSHLWVSMGMYFDWLNLKKGDRIFFQGYVRKYTRSDGTEDYGICTPYNIQVVKRVICGD